MPFMKESDDQGYDLYIFPDGACSRNPGPGAWGFIVREDPQGITLWENTGFCPQTTNNRMELQAAIEGLIWASEQTSTRIAIFSDSQYVVLGITQWTARWKANGWMTSQKKPVENRDLWERFAALNEACPHVSWNWVRGHNGHPGNEAVDALVQKKLRADMAKP